MQIINVEIFNVFIILKIFIYIIIYLIEPSRQNILITHIIDFREKS